MTEKTTEMIDKEIEKVMNKFESVEDIIGRIADENGRHGLVHRELRTFTWFVAFMIFSKVESEDDYDMKFKREYDNFRLGNDVSSADDLFKWACLYRIYNEKWYETDEYKHLCEII